LTHVVEDTVIFSLAATKALEQIGCAAKGVATKRIRDESSDAASAKPQSLDSSGNADLSSSFRSANEYIFGWLRRRSWWLRF
jgi:hypothetical protein